MKPTAFGMGWVLFCLALLLLSFHFNSNLALGFTFLTVSVWLASIAIGIFNFFDLSIELGIPGGNFAGRQLYIPCALNRFASGISVHLNLGDGFSQHNRHERQDGQLSDIVIELRKRGVYRSKSLQLESDYPFGFFRFYKNIELDHALDLTIYPKPEGLSDFPDEAVKTGREMLSDQQEISDVREYSPGDPWSRIHWKASARGAGLVTKQFEGGVTEEERIFCLPAGMPLEKGLSQLALWVVEAEKHGMAFVLDLGSGKVQAGRGNHHASRCLKALAGYSAYKDVGEEPK